jgi:hypothetical protein
MKTLDFYKYVSTDKTRKFMTGVYHKDGYKYATNGCVAIKIKADYPDKFEDKIVSPELTYIDGQFPNIAKVIPDLSDMVELTDVSPNDVLVKEFKSLKQLFSIHKKIGHWQAFNYVLPNRSKILFETWEKVIHFMEIYPDAKLYAHKEDGEEKSLMLISDDALLVFMPGRPFANEDTPLGYNWSFEYYNYEKHDEFEFLRVLRYIGAKGIDERYQNGNLTDKDQKVIDNLYRYLEIVGYEYKREVA